MTQPPTNNTTLPQGAYTYNSGITPTDPFITVYSLRNPTIQDFNYVVQKRWVNFATTPPSEWILESLPVVQETQTAMWKQFGGPGSGDVLGFIVPLGSSPVFPDSSGFVTYTSTGGSIAITGSTNTINWDLPGGFPTIQRLETDDGLFETPTGVPGTIIIHGGNNITTSQGTPHQVNIAVTGTTIHDVQIGNASGSLTSVPNGTTGEVLTAQTGADPIWASPAISGFTSINMQVITLTGTYTPTAGMSYCIIECLGGGGGGGGAAATGGATFSVGSGGGAGGYSRYAFSAASVGASQAVTIGSGGPGNSGTDGSGGGTTSVGALLSAAGGAGGSTGSAGSTAFANAAIGGNGNIGGAITGGASSGIGLVAASASVGFSGYGASSSYGYGGRPINIFSVAHGTGEAGSGYGSGGGGGINNINQTATLGGAGSAGLVIITEFIT